MASTILPSLLLLFLSLFSHLLPKAEATIPETPSWPTNCNFTRYENRKTTAAEYNSTPWLTSEIQCRVRCAMDTACGMYAWREDKLWCYYYEQSVKMWEEAGFPVQSMWMNDTEYVTASKGCEMQLCDQYPEYVDRKVPDDLWTDLIRTPNGTTKLTVKDCHTFCTLFATCRSATYSLDAYGWSYCAIYSLTTSDKSKDCEDKSLKPTCGSYTKYCGPAPYNPQIYSSQRDQQMLNTFLVVSDQNQSLWTYQIFLIGMVVGSSMCVLLFRYIFHKNRKSNQPNMVSTKKMSDYWQAI